MTEGSAPLPASMRRSRSAAAARIGERGAAFRHDRFERVQARLVVVVEAARLVVEEMAKPRQALANRQDLVDLLLVLRRR